MSKDNQLLENLEALRNAARALRWALLKADAEAINDAVQSQANPLIWLREHAEQVHAEKDQTQIRELSLQISDLNQQNRTLSQNGLCAVRQFLPAEAPAGYDATGTVSSNWEPAESLGATA